MLAAGIAVSQTPTSFEVASIKPSISDDRRVLVDIQPGGRFSAANVTVKRLIERAYDVKDFQISGGPSWIGSDLFDINAKPEEPVQPEQVAAMLQSLLIERFELKTHRHTKEMTVYALVVARNGPKLKPEDGSAQAMVRIRRGLFVAPKGQIAVLVSVLSNILDRTVIDKTGRQGLYNMKLEWVPDENQVAMFSTMGVPEGFGAPARDWVGPTLFTALEEQLGLRLESTKGPVEMLVVDGIQRPSVN